MIHRTNMTIFFTAALVPLACFCTLASAQDKEWAGFSRYRADNEKIIAARTGSAERPVAVLMGDSVTDGWFNADPGFFKDNNLVGRGISGQCTSQMLVRFQRDVVELLPKYVAILAGINDIAHNEGYSSVENTFRNIVSMSQIARKNKIRMVLCTIPPAARIVWRTELGDISDQVRWLNDNLRKYAAANRFKLVDYAAVLGNARGVTDAQYSEDQVHPNLEGYKVMEAALLSVLR